MDEGVRAADVLHNLFVIFHVSFKLEKGQTDHLIHISIISSGQTPAQHRFIHGKRAESLIIHALFSADLPLEKLQQK